MNAIEYTTGACSLGFALVAMSSCGICAISLGDDPEPLTNDLVATFSAADCVRCDSSLKLVLGRIIKSIDCPQHSLKLPLDLRGTQFQQRVWTALWKVPIGTTTTYAGLAKNIGMPKSIRAVAGACAANRIAVAVPCHRVIRSDGSISGYRWGPARKAALLQMEMQYRFSRR